MFKIGDWVWHPISGYGQIVEINADENTVRIHRWMEGGFGAYMLVDLERCESQVAP